MRPLVNASFPARTQIRKIGIEFAGSFWAKSCPWHSLREGWCGDEVLDGFPADPQMASNGTLCHADAMQRHDLLIASNTIVSTDLLLAVGIRQRSKLCLVGLLVLFSLWLLRRKLLVGFFGLRMPRENRQGLRCWREGMRWRFFHGRIFGQRERRALAVACSLQMVAQVLHQMIAVCHLNGLWQRPVDCIRIGTGAVSADHFNFLVACEPGQDGISSAVRQEIERLASFDVHQKRAVAVSPSESKVVNAQHAHSCGGRGSNGPQV